MKLDTFFDKDLPNHYLKYPHLDVFVRNGQRLFYSEEGYGEFNRCLDIVNVNVHPKYQRKGVFSDFLKLAEETCIKRDVPYVFVENVLNKHLPAFLIRQGYSLMPYRLSVPCYFKCVMKAQSE